jgi:hypothetical protein
MRSQNFYLPPTAEQPSTTRRKGSRLNPQKIARITGILFLITFIGSIPAQFILYHHVLNNSHYILGAGGDTRVFFGAFLELMVVIANIGTAVVLYPIVKRQNQGIALGYITSRVVESVAIMMGIFSLLTIVTLRQNVTGTTGADTATLVIAGKSLVAFHDWTFLFGPGLFAGVGNGMLLGYLMYRSDLVPRRLALLGLIGGPLIAVAFVAVLFGVFDAGSAWQGIATAPEFCWELSLGIYLIVKGFKPASVLALGTRGPVIEPSLAAA